MLIRCSNCNSKVLPDTKGDNWSRLAHFFEFAYNEEHITEATRDAMMTALMDFKVFAYEDCDKS